MSVTVDQKNRRICGGLTALLSLLLVLISAPAYGQPNSTRNPASQNQANQNIDAALVNSHEQSVASLLPTATGPDKPAHLTAITHCEIFFQSEPEEAAILNEETKKCIAGLIEDFGKLTDAKLNLYGHRHPTEEDNLSFDRAKSIRDYLVNERMIDRRSVTEYDFGSACPHPGNKDNKNEKANLNRRVQIWIVPQDKEHPENEEIKKCLKNVPKTNPPESSATSNGVPPS